MWNVLALIGWMVVTGLGLAAGAAPAAQPTRPGQPAPAVVIPIQGQINDYTRDAFLRRVEQARNMGAKTIIVDLNTPGGAVEPSLDLTRALRGLQDMRTIAYINPRAYSAGTLIALACNEVVMAPDSVIGDCAPIAIAPGGQLQPLPDTERGKAVSPILADFEASARKNGYNTDVVRAMVVIEPVVYLLEGPNGEYRAANAEEKDSLVKGGEWKLVSGIHQPVDDAKTLLTVHDDVAKMLGLSKGTARNLDDLAAQRNLNIIGNLRPSSGEKVIEVLASPVLRMLLFSIFLTCLYAAFHTPGTGFAEVACAILLAVLVGVPLMTGYAQWWEILAILVGIALLAVELFVIPGFGVAGFAGIALILVGFLFTFVAPEPGRWPLSMPTLPITWYGIQRGLVVIVAGLSISFLMSWWLRRYLPKLPYFNKLILTTTVGGSDAAMVGSISNIDPLTAGPAVGATGLAVTDLRPSGSAQFTDPAGATHVVGVVSDSGYVTHGTNIVVQEVCGNRIVVRPVKQP